jgi:hypothetical protein
VKKQIQRWSNAYKNQIKKRQLEELIGSNLISLIKSCEDVIFDNTGERVYSKFRDLGGINNHGMLMHYSIENNRAVAISKVEDNLLAERECRFLTWQKKYRRGVLSAEPIGIVKIDNESYTCFISSVLEHQTSFSYFRAEELFKLMGETPELLSYLSLSGFKKDLANEIDGSTKIKSILVNLISRFNTENAENFYKEFLSVREVKFSSDKLAYEKLQDLMHNIYDILKKRDLQSYEGLVHGDFKPQNILKEDEVYKVIDCQYYTYGIRLWDLAFLYSKNKNGFSDIKNRIDTLPSLDEKLLVVFFYILASIINVKEKRSKKITRNQLSPAVAYGVQLLSSID